MPRASATRRHKGFVVNVRRGRRFEGEEKGGWTELHEGKAIFEAPTTWKGRKGRVDIRVGELGDLVSVVEIKATDWDGIPVHRIRPTVLRHACQLWRYVKKEVKEGTDTCPGLIYQHEPAKSETKALVEQLLNDRMLQVVWRNGPMQHEKALRRTPRTSHHG